MSARWITPTIQEIERIAVVTEPEEIAGRVVVGRLDLAACGLPSPADHHAVCGLVEGHDGAHWTCSASLVEQGGPFALMRSVLEDAESA